MRFNDPKRIADLKKFAHLTLEEAALRLGLKACWVFRLYHLNGIKRERHGSGRWPISMNDPDRKKMRAYLLENRSRTLDAVGKENGVTRERIRQLYELHGITRVTHIQKLAWLCPKAFVSSCLALESIPEMSKAMHVKPNHVLQLLKFYGLKFESMCSRRARLKLRKCFRCGVVKKFKEFGADQYSCKACGSHRQRVYALRNGTIKFMNKRSVR